MTEFRPECIINLHVEERGRPAKIAWACSIFHQTRGHLVQARKFMGMAPREVAETDALLFGLRQMQRLLQEKVEVTATFPLKDKFADKSSGRRIPPELRSKTGELVKLWNGFRLHRIGDLGKEEEALLREMTTKAYARKRHQGDE